MDCVLLCDILDFCRLFVQVGEGGLSLDMTAIAGAVTLEQLDVDPKASQ